MAKELRECDKHGITEFKSEKQNKNGYSRWRCVACSYDRQLKSYRNTKKKLVDACGGKCKKCGYNFCLDAMDFHHLDPSMKEFKVSQGGIGFNKKLEEAKKCILLCCRCHREVEAKMVFIV